MANLPKSDTPESFAAHRAYYAQFVNAHVRGLVAGRIGLPTLLASKDPHLNDIPLARWDAFWTYRTASGGYGITPPGFVADMIRATGEGASASTAVCILKEAARQVIEAARKA